MSPFFYTILPSLSSGDNLGTFLSILLISFHLIGTSLPSFRDGLIKPAAFLSRYLPLKIPASIAELKKLCAHKLASFHLFVKIVLRKKRWCLYVYTLSLISNFNSIYFLKKCLRRHFRMPERLSSLQQFVYSVWSDAFALPTPSLGWVDLEAPAAW